MGRGTLGAAWDDTWGRRRDGTRERGMTRRQIARAARGYRRMFGLLDAPYRYDVVTVVAKPGDCDPRIDLLKSFWTDEQLRKRNWHDPCWY